jgi:hypothetical protein
MAWFQYNNLILKKRGGAEQSYDTFRFDYPIVKVAKGNIFGLGPDVLNFDCMYLSILRTNGISVMALDSMSIDA